MSPVRKAQIIVEIEDKSLEELNKEIKALDASIKQLKVNSQEWVVQNEKLGKLKTQYNQAKDAAVQLQNVVKKTTVTMSDQIRAVAKTGAGLVGTFTTISGSLKLIGINSEAFDEMTAKATTLMSIMGGLNQVAETFSSTNLKGLKGIGSGFKTLVTTVKGASTAMKAALISTGIGALVVAVGLLIANWDKLKNLLDRTGKQRAKIAEEESKSAKAWVNTEKELYDVAQREFDLQKEKAKYNKNNTKLAKAELQLANQRLNISKASLAEAEAEVELLNTQSAKKLKISEDEFQAQKDIADAKVEGLKIEIELNKLLVAENKLRNDIVVTTDDLNESIRIQENELTKVNAGLDTESKQYEIQRNILIDQVKKIQAITEADKKNVVLGLNQQVISIRLTKEEQDQLDALNAQIAALDIQEKLRKQKLADELLALEYERSFTREIYNINDAIDDTINKLNKRLNSIEGNKVILEDEYNIIEDINKNYEKMLKARQNIADFDEKGLEIFQKQHKVILDQLDGFERIFEATRNMLLDRIDVKKINENVLNQLTQELTLYIAQNEKKIEQLQNTKEGLALEREKLLEEKERLALLDVQLDRQFQIKDAEKATAEGKLASAKNEEERKTALEEVLRLENEIRDINQSIADNKATTIDLDNKINETEGKILDTGKEIYKTSEDIEQKTRDTTAAVEEQSRAYQRISDFMDDYSEQLKLGAEILGQSLEFISTLFDANATRIQDEINRLNAEYEMMNAKEADRQSRLLQYEEELRDANGTRYDELLELIEKEKQAKDSAYISEKEQRNNLLKLEHQRLIDERKAAMWRKTQAIIDIITQTALAVINYASKVVTTPLIPWVVGLGAAQIATVAAQKIPEVPPLVQYKKGGYTGEGNDDDIAGITHANEYVVPAKVVRKPEAQKHIEILESMRNTGYKDGGFVSPSLSQDVTSQFDYDKFAEKLVEALRTLPNPVVGLVDIDQGLKSIHLTKKQASLTR